MISTRALVLTCGWAALLAGGFFFAHGARKQQLTEAPLLPMKFAHIDHQVQNCVACHHNFTDDTGQGLCLDCHKNDPDIRDDMETMFHDLCRGCHVEIASTGEPAGPTRACESCHVDDALP